jgi:drug/metabolite transporter (DMT)-like permease
MLSASPEASASYLLSPFIFQLSGLGMSVSVLGPVTALYIIVPAVLGVALLGESLTLRKVSGVLLAMTAIYLLASEESGET